MSLRVLTIAALVVAPTASAASTLDVLLQVFANAGQEVGMNEEFTYNPGPVETLSDAQSDALLATGSFGEVEAGVDFEYVGATGLLRAELDASVSEPPPEATFQGSASSLAYIDLREQYAVSGAGTITFGLSIDATWDAIQWLLSSQIWLFDANGLTSIGTASSNKFLDGFTNGLTGSLFDEVVELSFDVDAPSGGMIEFQWLLNGLVTAGNTNDVGDSSLAYAANIFVLTEGSLTATPQTAGFLAGPGTGGTDPDPDPEVNVIPLPASALLLLAGLGGLGVLRRRRVSVD